MNNKNSNVYLDAKTSFLEPVVEQYGSHMVMSNVKKATRIKYINIDTRFNDEYTNGKNAYSQINSYTITLPEKLRDVKSIRVTNIEIPNVFYNFTETIGNNSFMITNLDEPYEKKIITIPNGNYSPPDELNNTVAGQISAAFGTISSGISNNRTYINTNEGNFLIDFGMDSSGNFDKYNFRSKLGWALGFRSQKYTITIESGIFSESIINLNTIRYLYLVVDEFSSGFTNSFICPLDNHLMNKKVLARISVDKKFFPVGTVQISNTFNGLLLSDVRYYNGKVDLQKINVQLVNEYGDPVDLNGNDFSFLLEVTYE
jgi:hypothetical protein